MTTTISLPDLDCRLQLNRESVLVPAVAKQYAMPVLMANCAGFCDNFLSVGKSAVWTKEGELVGQLDDKTEGILIFDTETEEVTERIIINNR